MTFLQLEVGDEFQIQNLIPPVVTFPMIYRKVSTFEYARTDSGLVGLTLVDIPVTKLVGNSPAAPRNRSNA